jgi:predicted phosphoribosyltransferase
MANIAGRTVILVDDGIAAGSTIRTAIAALRKHEPARIVVAVPTAHDTSLAAIRRLADEVCCPDVRGGFSFAVADAYEEWRDLSEDEVAAMLSR